MEIKRLNCVSCGAPISIPNDVDQITCTSCGTSLIIQRGEGYVALKVAEKITRSIEDSGRLTQEAIIQSSLSTQNQLQRLQLQYELSTAELKLSNVREEMRSLIRSGLKSKQPLVHLYFLEFNILEQIRTIWKKINSLSDQTQDNEISALNLQLKLISNSKQALRLANQNDNRVRKNKDKLENEETKIRNRLSALMKKKIVNQLSSPLDKNISKLNENEVKTTLNLIKDDIKTLEEMPISAEQKEVLNDLRKQHDDLYRIWLGFEKERLSKLLITNMNRDIRTITLNQAKSLSLGVKKDIQTLNNVRGNPAASYFLKLFQDYDNDLNKQIKKLQRKQKISIVTKRISGIFVALTVAISSFISDLTNASPKNKQVEENDNNAARSENIREEREQTSPDKKQSDIEHKDDDQSISTYQDEVAFLDNKSSDSEKHVISSDDTPPFKKSRKGIAIIPFSIPISFIVFVIFSCIGFVGLFLFIPEISETGSPDWMIGLPMLPITISFFLASLMFYSLVAPAAGFRFLNIKTPLHVKTSKVSIVSFRIFTAITIFLSSILLFINILLFVENESLLIFIFCFGSVFTIIGVILPFVLIKKPKNIEKLDEENMNESNKD